MSFSAARFPMVTGIYFLLDMFEEDRIANIVTRVCQQSSKRNGEPQKNLIDSIGYSHPSFWFPQQRERFHFRLSSIYKDGKYHFNFDAIWKEVKR
jgi:hypothetical protein